MKKLRLSLTYLMITITSVWPVTVVSQQVKPADPLGAAKLIEDGADNGIYVDMIKVYDDRSLQLMLDAARARLAALSGFDQNALTSRIGATTGASLQQQAISAQVLGPPIPGSTIASLGATGSTQTNTNTTAGTTSSQGPTGTTQGTTGSNSQTTVVNTGLPTQNVTTNNPQQNASVPNTPTLNAALPTTGYSVSSLDALNEMMQLTYEIANLQLLLEGSLTDRYAYGSRNVKPRTTLGFPITVTPQERYKDAVAFVEVDAINPYTGTFNTVEKPTVTALLPREKTYNVASITDNMTSIGGGVVSQVFNAGFSFLRGRKTYYLVQDQDTLATMKVGPTARSTAFSWQFRPVLGQRYVKAGMKQSFVQLAAPLEAATPCFGGVKITTYWRKYDRKRGILKEVIPDSIRIDQNYRPIPVYDQVPVIQDVDYDDIGNGQLQVNVAGQFPNGTRIRVGNNILGEGSPGFVLDQRRIRFVADVSDLVRYKAYLSARDGTLTEVVENQPALNPPSTTCVLTPPPPPVAAGPPAAAAAAPPAAVAGPAARATTISVEAFDGLKSTVTVNFGVAPTSPDIDGYVINIGGNVYGLSDAPIERIGKGTLRVVVPNTVLQSTAVIETQPLFYTRARIERIANPFFNLENAVEKIVAFDSGGAGGNKRYLLYGSRLATATIVVPSGVALTLPPGYADNRTLRMFELTPAQEKDLKRIYVRKGPTERPVVVAMPGGDAKPDDKDKPIVTVTISTPPKNI